VRVGALVDLAAASVDATVVSAHVAVMWDVC